MKKNILMRTNVLICLIIVVGFLLTAFLGYRANYSTSVENIEQVSALTSEGIYYQLSTLFTKPVNISLTMANDSLLRACLQQEPEHLDSEAYLEQIRGYLNAYREKYGYDSVFLVSTATGRYYNFEGLDRVLTRDDPENVWYYELLERPGEYDMNVDNDEAAGDEITVFVNCKVRDEDGGVLGIVGVGMRISDLQGLLGEYEAQFGVDAYLIDEEGVIEISTEHTGYEQVSLFSLHAFGEEAEGKILGWREEGRARSFWTPDGGGGRDRDYVVTRFLPELSWHLVVERDTGALMEQLQRQMVHSVLIIAAIIAIILFVITTVIRGFNRQILTLNEERERVFRTATEELYDHIYELNITHNCAAGSSTQRYFESLGVPKDTPYDKALQVIAQKQIKEEFRAGYVSTFSPENVLGAFARGQTNLVYDFMFTENGSDYLWMRIDAHIFRWPEDGSVRMFTYRKNIDAEKRQVLKMAQKAQTDEMTGLYTKTDTKRRVEALLGAHPEQTYALFLLDIDNFKQANDLCGHMFGDAVIVEFTGKLRRQFRKEDVVGRVGGDEFAAFVPAPDARWAGEKARALCAALNWMHQAEHKSWHVSASVGVALTCCGEARAFQELYRRADEALYETKKRGKNGYTVFGG